MLVTSDLHLRRHAIHVVMMAVMQMRQHNYREDTGTAPAGSTGFKVGSSEFLNDANRDFEYSGSSLTAHFYDPHKYGDGNQTKSKPTSPLWALICGGSGV